MKLSIAFASLHTTAKPEQNSENQSRTLGTRFTPLLCSHGLAIENSSQVNSDLLGNKPLIPDTIFKIVSIPTPICHFESVSFPSVSIERHLLLQERTLQCSDEWMPSCQSWIVIRVAAGAGYWLKGETGGEMNVGDCLVLGFDDKTRLRASSLWPMQLQFYTVQPQYLIGLITMMEWHQFEAPSGNLRSHILFFRANEPMGRAFARLTEQSHGSNLAARCALLQFWADAIEKVPTPLDDSPAESGKLRDRFRRLFRQMSETELTTCSLQELSQQLHCSERHFCRLFREQFGIPLRIHKSKLRLLRARQLLKESSATITDVAGQCGYRNVSFFIGRFRKLFGMTPGEWRRQARKG